MVLVDAGPLVALIRADDRHHGRCHSVLEPLPGPMATVWPAFTEAMYLLGFSWRAQDALWQFVCRGALALLPLDENDLPRIRQLMKQYRDLPMDLADAALVRAAEKDRIKTVFTLDQSDFRVYRPAHTDHFELLPTL
jgi:hypothetical protein